MRLRNTVFVCLFALGLLALAGCAKIDVTTDIHADGTGTVVMALGFDTSMTGADVVKQGLQEAVQSAKQAGAKVEDWKDGKYQGYKVTYPYSSFEQMAALLTQDSSNSGLGQLFTQASASVDEQKQVHFQASGDWSVQLDVGQQMKFTVIMPGKIVSYSEQEAAQKTGSDRVTWDLMKFTGRQAQLSVVSEIGKAKGFPWAAVIGGVLGLLLLGLIALLVLRRRKGAPGTGKATCPVCGAPIAPTDLFCLKCGSRLPKA